MGGEMGRIWGVVAPWIFPDDDVRCGCVASFFCTDEIVGDGGLRGRRFINHFPSSGLGGNLALPGGATGRPRSFGNCVNPFFHFFSCASVRGDASCCVLMRVHANGVFRAFRDFQNHVLEELHAQSAAHGAAGIAGNKMNLKHRSHMKEKEPMISSSEPQAPLDEPFIDKKEACRRLSLKQRTIDSWMRRGVLPYYKMGQSVRFKWSEINTKLTRTCRVQNEE